jgi:hypothetical protein
MASLGSHECTKHLILHNKFIFDTKMLSHIVQLIRTPFDVPVSDVDEETRVDTKLAEAVDLMELPVFKHPRLEHWRMNPAHDHKLFQ